MAITLDTIVNKVFKVVKNGYDNNEVESFLDEILEEMENREAQTAKLEAQVKSLTEELEQARAQLAARPAAQAATAAAPAPVKAADNRRSSESFELVLTKAQGVYDEIVAAADARAEEIVAKANDEAASLRANAESQISDLTEKLSALRKQTADYYASVKQAVDAQSAGLDQIKKLL